MGGVGRCKTLAGNQTRELCQVKLFKVTDDVLYSKLHNLFLTTVFIGTLCASYWWANYKIDLDLSHDLLTELHVLMGYDHNLCRHCEKSNLITARNVWPLKKNLDILIVDLLKMKCHHFLI